MQSVINSPIFQPASFSAGSTNLGYTQFGDAFQRANFWNFVSRRAPDYHVLLGQPRVFFQTINVPADKGIAGPAPPLTDGIIGLVAGDWLDQQIQQLITTLGIDPQTLPIFVTHNAVGFGLGYHAMVLPSQDNRQRGVQTYIEAGDFDQDIFAGTLNNASDVDVLSHEVSEWLDDPFINNLVPPFVEPEAFFGCSGFHQKPDGPLVGLLEVGDPIRSPTFPEIPVTLNGMTYHLQDEVFLSWFTRSSPSTAVNGYYSFANGLKTFAQLCPNFTDYTFTPVDEPDGLETHLFGINNNGQVVGYYYDFEFGLPHGFLLSNGNYSHIDVPGARFTLPWKINDAGEIVGYYRDAAHHLHGFLLSHGSFQTIDAPGATATFALGINNRQEIVGGYVGANGVVHGFLQQDGQFRTVDLPFAFEDELEAINDSGEMVGDYDTGNVSDNFGFIGKPNHFEPLMFPGSFLSSPHSINREREVVGWYYYPTYSNFFDPLPSGFIKNGQNNTRIRVFSNGFECPTTLDGNNDAGQAVGSFFDPSIGMTRGVIVTPKRRHGDAGDDR